MSNFVGIGLALNRGLLTTGGADATVSVVSAALCCVSDLVEGFATGSP